MPDLFVPDTTTAPTDAHSSSLKTASGKRPHHHWFASYCDHPAGIHFQTQEPNENILLFLRKHIITNLPWIFFVVILLLIPLLLTQLLDTTMLTTISPDFLPPNFMILLTLFYYLIVFGYALVSFITWFFNISLVTQRRIIDIDYSDVVYHNVAATKLTLVQDVDYTQTGVIRSVFNYGDVFVQTASESPNFDFLAVPRPAQATQIIEGLIGKKPYIP